MGREERNGVELLEGAAGDKMSLRGAGEEKEWKCVDIRIANLGTYTSVYCKESNWALHTPAIACKTPGPPTTKQTPGLPVRYPYALAAYPAACSFLKPMNLMPSLIASSATSTTGMPTMPKTMVTPISLRLHAMIWAPVGGAMRAVKLSRFLFAHRGITLHKVED